MRSVREVGLCVVFILGALPVARLLEVTNMLDCPRTSSRLLAGIWLAGTCLIAKAPAAEPAELTETVSTADLDLKTASGAALLNHRIFLAARNVCSWVDPGKRIDFAPFADCVRSAMHDASPQTQAVLARAREGGVIVAGAGTPH